MIPMNPLNDHPQARKIAYYAQFVIGGVLLLLGVGFAAAQVEFPVWYNVATAVFAAAGTYLGLTAAQNTDTFKGYSPDNFGDEGVVESDHLPAHPE
jgi:hypothetical protein